MKKLKVAVGLSGGVDSAVSAYLLKKQGFDVSGCYLHCFDDDEPGCRGKQDHQDALTVALYLKIPFRVLDFRRQYKTAVIGYFKKEYLAGRTPNPDVVCNRDIKFGLLLDWCIKNRFDYLATGHYARLVSTKTIEDRAWKVGVEDRRLKIDKSDLSSTIHLLPPSSIFHHLSSKKSPDVFLVRPADEHKDQTYFLWAVPRQKFSRVLFPLADFYKQDVRSAARLSKIPVADKPDSTGICFVGEVRVGEFLKSLGVKEKRGEVVIKKLSNSKFQIPNSKQSQNPNDQNSKRLEHSDLENSKLFGACDLEFGASDDYEVIGRHRGVWFYTIGQRRGFSVDRWPPKNNSELVPDRPPLYVIAKDVCRNRLVVGFGAETYRDNFQVSDCNWLAPELTHQWINASTHCLVRIRHLGDLIPCRLSVVGCRLSVALATPVRGVAPGQSAVFYSKDGLVLGGGVIQ